MLVWAVSGSGQGVRIKQRNTIMSTENKNCPACGKETLSHKHSTAHGIPGTHMAGSEHFTCPCGFYVGSKEYAEKHGLTFVLDV